MKGKKITFYVLVTITLILISLIFVYNYGKYKGYYDTMHEHIVTVNKSNIH